MKPPSQLILSLLYLLWRAWSWQMPSTELSLNKPPSAGILYHTVNWNRSPFALDQMEGSEKISRAVAWAEKLRTISLSNGDKYHRWQRMANNWRKGRRVHIHIFPNFSYLLKHYIFFLYYIRTRKIQILYHNILSHEKFLLLVTCFFTINYVPTINWIILCWLLCPRFTDMWPLILPIFLTLVSKKGPFHSWTVSCASLRGAHTGSEKVLGEEVKAELLFNAGTTGVDS